MVVVVVVVAVAEVLMVVMVITALKIHPQPPKLLLPISRKWGVYIMVRPGSLVAPGLT